MFSMQSVSLNPLTLSQTTNFRLFQMLRLCRQQFQIGRKWQNVIKKGRNTVGKGEIAGYKQFLLFPQCFQKTCSTDTSKQRLVWERVNSQISVVVCSLFEFGTVSKWYIREWVKPPLHRVWNISFSYHLLKLALHRLNDFFIELQDDL